MLSYYGHFEEDCAAGGYVVTFPDFQFGVTQGDTLEEAMERAADIVRIAVQDCIEKNQPLPVCRKHRGRSFRQVTLSGLDQIKAELYAAFSAAGITKSELARRLKMPKTNVDRLFDLDHESRFAQLEAAFRVLGKSLVIETRDAA